MDIECDVRIRNATPEELAPFLKTFASSNNVKVSRQGMPQNFQVVPWSPEEKAAIAGCKDETEAWDRYHEQFPESIRTRDAVRRKFQNLKDEEPAPATTYKVAPGAAPAHHITPGDKVRHTAAYPLFSGVGIVTKISLRGDEVMVDFGSGVEWLDRKNLEIVPAEAKVVVSVP